MFKGGCCDCKFWCRKRLFVVSRGKSALFGSREESCQVEMCFFVNMETRSFCFCRIKILHTKQETNIEFEFEFEFVRKSTQVFHRLTTQRKSTQADRKWTVYSWNLRPFANCVSFRLATHRRKSVRKFWFGKLAWTYEPVWPGFNTNFSPASGKGLVTLRANLNRNIYSHFTIFYIQSSQWLCSNLHLGTPWATPSTSTATLCPAESTKGP